MSIGSPVMLLIVFQFSSFWCLNNDWRAGSLSGAYPWKIPSTSGSIVVVELTDQKFLCSTGTMLLKWSIMDYYLSSVSKPIYKASEVISIETNTFASGCCRRSKVRAVAIVSIHSSITKKCSCCCWQSTSIRLATIHASIVVLQRSSNPLNSYVRQSSAVYRLYATAAHL